MTANQAHQTEMRRVRRVVVLYESPTIFGSRSQDTVREVELNSPQELVPLSSIFVPLPSKWLTPTRENSRPICGNDSISGRVL